MIEKFYSFKNLPKGFYVKKGENLLVNILLNNDFEGIKSLKVNMQGENATFDLRCAVILKGSKKLSFNVEVEHKKGNNFSRFLVKSLLCDSTNFSFEGLIKIRQKAFQSDAYLKHACFISSESSTVTTSPKLEIEANNVKASHGASIKSFDENELFYMISRGLSLSQAKKILTQGFIESTFNDYENVKLQLS